MQYGSQLKVPSGFVSRRKESMAIRIRILICFNSVQLTFGCISFQHRERLLFISLLLPACTHAVHSDKRRRKSQRRSQVVGQGVAGGDSAGSPCQVREGQELELGRGLLAHQRGMTVNVSGRIQMTTVIRVWGGGGEGTKPEKWPAALKWGRCSTHSNSAAQYEDGVTHLHKMGPSCVRAVFTTDQFVATASASPAGKCLPVCCVYSECVVEAIWATTSGCRPQTQNAGNLNIHI